MEYSFYKHLEGSGVAIGDIGYEAIRIPYKVGKKERSYIPDFLVGDSLYEVKPLARQKGRVFANKMTAAYRHAASSGLKFTVVSEKDFRIIPVKVALKDPDLRLRPRRRRRSR